MLPEPMIATFIIFIASAALTQFRTEEAPPSSLQLDLSSGATRPRTPHVEDTQYRPLMTPRATGCTPEKRRGVSIPRNPLTWVLVFVRVVSRLDEMKVGPRPRWPGTTGSRGGGFTSWAPLRVGGVGQGSRGPEDASSWLVHLRGDAVIGVRGVGRKSDAVRAAKRILRDRGLASDGNVETLDMDTVDAREV